MSSDRHNFRFSRRASTRDAGFTLLEAIVAIAIIGFALIPLVSFLSLSANELFKAADSNERSFVTQATIALMDSVNPFADPSGSIQLNDKISISWDSQELISPGKNPVPNAGLPAYRLGLYKVHVTVTRTSTPWFDFDLRKVGYDSFQSDQAFTGTK